MSSKETYRRLCRQEKSIPLFSQDWWLDIVCGENKWDVLLLYGRQGNIEAAMPLYIPRKGYAIMPVYTQTLGPWIIQPASDNKYTSLLGRQQIILGKFAAELENLRLFQQNFSWSVTDWLPFYWKGFTQTTRYTYLLSGLHDTAQIWENMSQNTRRNIIRAEKKYKITVRKGIPAEEFIRIQHLTFQRQHKAVPPKEKTSCGSSLRPAAGATRATSGADMTKTDNCMPLFSSSGRSRRPIIWQAEATRSSGNRAHTAW